MHDLVFVVKAQCLAKQPILVVLEGRCAPTVSYFSVLRDSTGLCCIQIVCVLGLVEIQF